MLPQRGAIQRQVRVVASTGRPPGCSDLRRTPVLTMQVEGTAVAHGVRARPLVAITPGQVAQADFAWALGHCRVRPATARMVGEVERLGGGEIFGPGSLRRGGRAVPCLAHALTSSEEEARRITAS